MSDADAAKWNARYAAATPTFAAHPLAAAALAALGATPPAALVLELAAGPSGSALALADAGLVVTAVDASEIGLAQLAAEAARRGLSKRVRTIVADLEAWTPPPGAFALVLATHYWDARAFVAGARAVAPHGLIAWETFSLAERRYRPSFSPAYCLADDEPDRHLPPSFTVLSRTDHDDGTRATRRLVARRA